MPLSKARENYLVSYLEGETIAEVIRTKAMLNAHLIGLNTKEDMLKETFNAFKDYAGILLPSDRLPVRIEDMTKKDVISLKDTFKKLKEMRKSVHPVK